MHVDPRERIAGIPILEVRRLLRRLNQSDASAERLVATVLSIPESAASVLITELLRKHLIERVRQHDGEDWFSVTVAGRALASASAAKPIRRKTADDLLAKLMERVRLVNADSSFLYTVTEVRVFGSYLSDAERLSDVDVAIDVARREGTAGRE